jgi:hypothetical protein
MDQSQPPPATAPLLGATAPQNKGLSPQQKKYAKIGLAVLLAVLLIVIITVAMGKRCSNDFDCKFGDTCSKGGWCKA